jgi:hypothetical protein
MPTPISPTASARRCNRPMNAQAGWRRDCRICGPRPRPRRRRPSSSAAMWVWPISRACASWSNRPRRLNDLVLRVQNRYRELALESSFPVSAGRILSRALPPRDPSRPACHPCSCGGGVPGPSARAGRGGAARGARNRVPNGEAMSRGPCHCPSWAMCRPRVPGVVAWRRSFRGCFAARLTPDPACAVVEAARACAGGQGPAPAPPGRAQRRIVSARTHSHGTGRGTCRDLLSSRPCAASLPGSTGAGPRRGDGFGRCRCAQLG